MTQRYAEAALQGQATTATNGDLFQQVAASVSGDAVASTGIIRSTYTGNAVAVGDAVLSSSSRVDKFTEIDIVGDASTTAATPLYLLDGPDMAGDSSTSGALDLVLGGGSGVSGDASVAAQGSTLLGGGSAVSGDAGVTAAGLATRFASGLASALKFSNWSVAFDGADEYATVGEVLDFERTDSFSISCWVKTSAGGFLIAKQENAVPSGYMLQVGAATGTPSLGIIRFELNNVWTTNNLVVETTTTWADNQWHHIVVTYGGASTPSSIAIFVDNVDQAPLTTVYNNLTASISNGAAFNIGDRELDLGTKPFNGLVDEVAVYGKELTPTEVEWIYNGGVPNDLGDVAAPSDLLSWWRMGDGDTYPTLNNQVFLETLAVFPTIPDVSGLTPPTDLTVADFSGNDYHGERVNMESTDFVYGGPFGYAPTNEVTQAIDDETAYLWLLHSNEGLGGLPAVEQIDRSNRRIYGWTVGGTASETFIRGALVGTDIWIGGNDSSGHAQLKKMTLGAPPTFSAGYSVSSNSFVTMVYGGGYLWVADSAGLWRVDPSNPGGPHTAVASEVGIVDLAFDADGSNYGDSQPRLFAITDESGSRGIHRYELATPAQDDFEGPITPTAGGRAIAVGNGSVWTAHWNGTANTVAEWAPDPISFVQSSTSVNSYVDQLLDIRWDDLSSQVLTYGRYQAGDTRGRVQQHNSTLGILRSNLTSGNNVWASGTRQKMTQVGNNLYLPSKTSNAATRLEWTAASYVFTFTQLQVHKLPQFTRKFMRFDGVNEYVTMGDVLNFDWNDAYSYSLWFRTTAATGPFISKREDGPLYRGWAALMETGLGGTIGIFHTNGEGVANMRVRTVAAYNDGAWHHLCVTLDGTGTAAGTTVYVDGLPVTTTVVVDDLGTNTTINSASLNLASRNDGAGSFLAGDLDEVAVYDKELSAAEVAAIYNYGNPNDLSALGSSANLQAWWRMGEGTGVYNGTMTNMDASDNVLDVPRSSFCKYSLEFPYNANEYYSMGDVHAFEYTDSFTVSAWVKTTTPSGRWIYVADKLTGATAYRGWGFYVQGNDGRVRFFLNNDTATTNQIAVASTGTVNDGQWHHILATWSGSVTPVAADVSIYIDGVLQTPVVVNDNLTATIVDTASFAIGNRAAATTTATDGQLTEVSVWDKALDSTEAAWVYNSGLPRDLKGGGAPSNLVGWWRCGTLDNPYFQVRDFAFPKPQFTPLSLSLELNNDTVDEYVNFGNIAETHVPQAGEWSLGAWIKMTSTATGVIICKHGKWTGGGQGAIILYVDDPYIFLDRYLDNAYNHSYIRRNNPVYRDGNWHFIVGTYHDTDSPEMRLYIDGVYQSSVTSGFGSGGIGDRIEQFWVGARDLGSVQHFFQGKIIHSFFYTKRLTQEEITALYASGVPQDLSVVGPTTNLVHWCPLGNLCSPGTDTMVDLSGLGNHGTTVNIETTDFVEDVPTGPNPKETTTVKDVSRWNAHTAMVNLTSGDISSDTPGGAAIYSMDLNPHIDYFSYRYLNFSTGGGYVAMGNVLGFERNEPFSVSFWLRNGNTGNPDYILGKQEGSTTYRGWRVWLDTNEYLCFDLTSDDASSNKISVQVQTALPANTNLSTNYQFWHIVITYDGSSDAGGVAIYFNGVPQTVVPLTNNLTATILTSAAFQLGNVAWNTSSTYRVRGDMDEVSVYDKALNSTEVAWLYNSGVPNDLNDAGAPSNLVSWYRMGDGDTLPTITDNAGSNDGTITGSGMYVEYAYPPGTEKANEQLYSSVQLGSHHFENSWPWMISMWVKTTSEVGTLYYSGTNQSFNGMGVYLQQGYLFLGVGDTMDWYTETSYGYTIRSSTKVNDGAWHHIVVQQYTAKGANIWIDGVVESRVTEASGILNSISSTGWLVIGGHRMNYQPVDGFVGKIAEVSVWSGYLGQAAVDELYNGGSPPELESLSFSKRLDGWWRMGASAGNPGTPVNIASADYRKRGDAPGAEAWSSRSLDFDGGNDYLNLGDRFAFEWTAPFSISFWSKYNVNNALAYEFYCMAFHKANTGLPGWKFVYNTPAFDLRSDISGSGWLNMEIQDEKRFHGQEWYHVCVTWDGSGVYQGMNIYVDGHKERLTAAANYPFQPSVSTVTSYALHFAQSSASSWSKGQMDEVSFWDRELTEAEVIELVNGGAPADLTTHSAADAIEGWWRMGEGTADATMVNMEAEDFNADTPYEAAGGGATLTARALEDDEIAGDVLGDAVVVAPASLNKAAEAAGVGSASVSPAAIVRKAGLQPGPSTVVEMVEELRYVGFNPERKDHAKEPKVVGLLTDPGKVQEANRSAQRQVSISRKDTGVSSTPKK